MKRVLTLLALLALHTRPGAAQEFDLALTVTDMSVAAEPRAALIFGLQPGATDGYDGAPMDVQAPPPPPTGAFDARISNTSGLTNDAGQPIQGFLQERRAADLSDEQVVLTCAPTVYTNGSACQVSWDPGSLPAGGEFLISGSPDFAPVNMRTTSSIIIKQYMSGPPVPQLQPAIAVIDLTSLVPVELVLFEAVLDGSDVVLSWQTASETNNAGFTVERRRGDEPFAPLAFVPGRGTTLETQRYEHRVRGLRPGPHTFRLRQVDYDGAFTLSPEVEVEVADEALSRHGGLMVTPPQPNPFLTQTRFLVTLDRPQPLRAEVFDAVGRRVALLHEGDSVSRSLLLTLDGTQLPAGLYVVRVQGERRLMTLSALLVR